MSDDALDALAESHGIQIAFISEMGERQVIDDAAKRALLTVLGVDPDGGERGGFDESEGAGSQACALPPSLEGRRFWGVSCQLYALRSERNLGLGDFRDLADLAAVAAREGASFVGVNPLHALFFADPGRYSPYSPSSRRFLNPLYLAIDALDGGEAAIAALRREKPELFAALSGDLVDYRAVGAVKRALLDRLFEARRASLGGEEAFAAFRKDGGEALADFALFEAISEAEVGEGRHAGWHSWPEGLQDRQGDEVSAFARENEERILFHLWLQFEADRQLAAAQTRAREAGMAIGLYLDLAVGVSPDGSETWADPSLTVRTARVGSPPDMFNSSGQDWGLAPLSPKVLAERDYKPLRDAFDALTRHAGAARIDHAMGLARLWWIPETAKSSGGGYVRYSLAGMVGAVADASRRNSCLVIGEDLGTVPPGFRHAMETANILSYRVVYFERHNGPAFLPPEAYPPLSLACVSTHDLATLAGWWKGLDVKLRAETGTQDETATRRDLAERARDRTALIIALKEASVLPEHYDRLASGEDELPGEMPQDIAEAVHRFVARTPSMLVSVQLEDMVGAEAQPNLPGTTDQYPNWRVRSAVTLDDLPTDPRFAAIAAALRHERPNPA
ncbi:4-alpha-glucanotransferase [Aurantimonas sp. Leaf443]|uniref:4-alpha-glucanotransferase n=1 Tax=Aurantimonas sp. Leaf443 TaxID=1736378 RepID=UPI0007003EFE|nr:4-alpha-glucanotransferase [Aurantimonas sp. Leaf443]KQT85180.1 4-alpha-glucanotransferase [Aurantimonas sp. Leaf443]